MKTFKAWIYALCLGMALICQGCIFEYPYPTKGGTSDKGEDPTTFEAEIEVTYNLTWQNILKNIEFSTKTRARLEKPHRFVIEVLKDGEVIYHEIESLSSDDFSLGKLNHKIGVPLSASLHQIAVWYDSPDEDGNYPFDTDQLRNVVRTNNSTEESAAFQCAYASDWLDLTELAETGEKSYVKQLELQHAGAGFEIVADDVQQFITHNKEALNQGDKYTVRLSFVSGTSDRFNLHNESFPSENNALELSGWMRLPFAEYDSLKIAEGFLFCKEEDEVMVKLSVINSALITVSSTDFFTFPVKRGYVTTVTGNFLTNPVDGIFSVDNLWDGEIVFEI